MQDNILPQRVAMVDLEIFGQLHEPTDRMRELLEDELSLFLTEAVMAIGGTTLFEKCERLRCQIRG